MQELIRIKENSLCMISGKFMHIRLHFNSPNAGVTISNAAVKVFSSHPLHCGVAAHLTGRQPGSRLTDKLAAGEDAEGTPLWQKGT